MKTKISTKFFVLTFLVIAGCQKSEPVAVPPLQEYRDGSNLFVVKIPSTWQQSAEPGKLNIYNSQDSWNRFADPTSSSKSAVRMYIYAQEAGAKTLVAAAEDFKSQLRQEQAQIDPDVQTTLAGSPAVKIPYSLKLDANNTIYSYRIISVNDSMEYGVECQGFNDDFKDYTNVFDSVALTYSIVPKAVAQQQLPENMIPAATMASYQNDYFVIQYPDNFTVTPKGMSGGVLASLSIKGYRDDCTIVADVHDAKNLTVDKIFNQVKGSYPASARSVKTKVSGLDAYQISYSPFKGIQSRAYIVVKNNKWIRITLNWAEEMQKDYLPAFEKTVSSLKLK
ncbi:MAG TPA: hypothetical protein VLX91_06430 [Candidatus Acidoferrales bacterium]|nr:hypothetical protein [Candidatus Acidoferrales bacterium]